MAIERTFVMIKPDGIQRGIMGKILSRFEEKGLKPVVLRMIKMSRDLAERHYSIHKGKHFYDELIEFITSGPVLTSVWEGKNAVHIVRKLVGATSPEDAEPGTIRGDFVIDTGFNIVHASDSTETSKTEIDLFFKEDELLDYPLSIGEWLGK